MKHRYLAAAGAALPVVAVAACGPVTAAASSPAPGTAKATVAAAAATSTAAAARPAEPQTVTFEVSGTAAHVTYGPAGSSLSGSVPMKVTQPLAAPLYYSVQAQSRAVAASPPRSW